MTLLFRLGRVTGFILHHLRPQLHDGSSHDITIMIAIITTITPKIQGDSKQNLPIASLNILLSKNSK